MLAAPGAGCVALVPLRSGGFMAVAARVPVVAIVALLAACWPDVDDDAGVDLGDGGASVDGGFAVDAGGPWIDAGAATDSGEPVDAGGGAVVPPDAGLADGGDAGAPFDAGPVDAGFVAGCPVGIGGPSTIAMVVGATLSFDRYAWPERPAPDVVSKAIAAFLWFPEGRAPGRRAVLSLNDERGAFVASEIVLDAHAGGVFDAVSDGRWKNGTWIHSAVLVGPEDGLVVRVEHDVSPESSGDVVEPRLADGVLCRQAGAVPPASATWWTAEERPPVATFEAVFASPFDVAAWRDAVVVRVVDGGTLDPWVVGSSGRVQIGLVDAGVWPLGATIAFEADGFLDALGRNVPSLPPVRIFDTTATIQDLTLATEPPAGSIAPDFCLRDGGVALASCTSFSSFAEGLFALGDPGDAGFAIVDAWVDCPYGYAQSSYTPRLFRADSQRTTYVAVRDCARFADVGVVVPLPTGTGPVYLSVSSFGMPYPPTTFVLERVTFADGAP